MLVIFLGKGYMKKPFLITAIAVSLTVFLFIDSFFAEQLFKKAICKMQIYRNQNSKTQT